MSSTAGCRAPWSVSSDPPPVSGGTVILPYAQDSWACCFSAAMVRKLGPAGAPGARGVGVCRCWSMPCTCGQQHMPGSSNSACVCVYSQQHAWSRTVVVARVLAEVGVEALHADGIEPTLAVCQLRLGMQSHQLVHCLLHGHRCSKPGQRCVLSACPRLSDAACCPGMHNPEHRVAGMTWRNQRTCLSAGSALVTSMAPLLTGLGTQAVDPPL
jgi:hypothetical protein